MIDDELLDRFERARELQGEERAAYLAELEEADPRAAEEIASLLAADESGAGLLDRTPHRAASGTRETLEGGRLPPRREEFPRLDTVPERVGPYRILRQIGRGGMGRVFLAEQAGEGFRREIAVKRLDRNDPSPTALRRFRDEAKILASLEHPGIARFLDGGRDNDGTAWIALEFVEGVDLLAHAAELPLVERLRLFVEVLQAVDYAHQRRVVHRDLKPGNILVGRDGRPRLLDFGISKLVVADEGEPTATQTEFRALTPAYASPEQIGGEPVGPASDIYSLGVVLYELLSGVRPFEPRPDDPRYLERAVLELEPDPPSTAVRRATRAREPSGVETTRPRPVRFGRDLDAICLRALRKEPERRYGSVREFAADIERYLAGLPVAARRGGWTYRIGKRLRRQRQTLAVGVAAAALAALAVHVALRDPRERRLTSTAPPARPMLAPIGELSARFAESPNRPELGLALVRALLDAGRGPEAMSAVQRLRQLPGNLGEGPAIDLAEAEAALAVSEFQRAAATALTAEEGAKRAGDPALARRSRLVHARTLMRLAAPEEAERRVAAIFAEAEAAKDEALAAEALIVRAMAARRAALNEQAPIYIAEGIERAQALALPRVEIEGLNARGRFEGESGELDRGLATLEQALALARSVGWVTGEATALLYKSALLNWKGDSKAAFEVAAEAAERLRACGNREQLLTTLGNLAIVRIENGELAEAEAVIAEGEALQARIGTPIARAQIFRARAYLQDMRGDAGGARVAYRSAIDVAREAGLTSQLAVFLSDYAWFEVGWSQTEAAETAAKEAVTLFERGGDERTAIEVGGVVAYAEAKRGDVARARRHILRLRRAAAESDSGSARFAVRVAESRIHEALGELPEAIAARRETVKLAEGFASPALAAVQRSALLTLLGEAGLIAEERELATALLPDAERIGMADVVRKCRAVLAAH